VLRALEPAEFAVTGFGVPTVKDIFAELEKPGRDPRPGFKTAAFKDTVQTMRDLEVGMTLEGVVTNVANFGAFVDIGVHQDGLVHVSQLADRFIKDPREVVKTGEIIKVTVVEVDLKRRRIALTMKRQDKDVAVGHPRPSTSAPASGRPRDTAPGTAPPPAAPNTAMAAAFTKRRRRTSSGPDR
jgi:uncharacterized protein